MTFADSTYVVQPGDTLTGIALALGLCSKGPGNTNADWANCLGAAQRLADANGIADFNAISVGQQLVISTPAVDAPAASLLPVSAGTVRSGFAGLASIFLVVAVIYYGAAAYTPKKERR